jgi:hypothetical protein
MADAEGNYWGLEMDRRAEKERAAERKRAKRAGRGVARLKKEAAKQVKQKSKELVDALMEKALQGHVASAKLVVELAEAQPVEGAKPKPRRRGLSEAERLALEPSWDSLTPEQQKQILIRDGEWDLAHDCRKGEWVPTLEEQIEMERLERERGGVG